MQKLAEVVGILDGKRVGEITRHNKLKLFSFYGPVGHIRPVCWLSLPGLPEVR